MLIQNDKDRIVLLPALPKQWTEGEIRGVTAAGGIRAELAWKDGRLARCLLSAERNGEVTVVYGAHKKRLKLAEGVPVEVNLS